MRGETDASTTQHHQHHHPSLQYPLHKKTRARCFLHVPPRLAISPTQAQSLVHLQPLFPFRGIPLPSLAATLISLLSLTPLQPFSSRPRRAHPCVHFPISFLSSTFAVFGFVHPPPQGSNGGPVSPLSNATLSRASPTLRHQTSPGWQLRRRRRFVTTSRGRDLGRSPHRGCLPRLSTTQRNGREDVHRQQAQPSPPGRLGRLARLDARERSEPATSHQRPRLPRRPTAKAKRRSQARELALTPNSPLFLLPHPFRSDTVPTPRDTTPRDIQG